MMSSLLSSLVVVKLIDIRRQHGLFFVWITQFWTHKIQRGLLPAGAKSLNSLKSHVTSATRKEMLEFYV